LVLLSGITLFAQKPFQLSDSVVEPGQTLTVELIFINIRLHPSELPFIDTLAQFLNKNQNLRIEVGCHTDCRDSEDKNLIISTNWAREIKYRLEDTGIDSSRIETKGYGESDPIIVSEEIHQQYPFLKVGEQLTETYINSLKDKNEQDFAHRLNRRTEFKTK
jgi:peptidoglycan-associated lipoprotein